MAEVNVLKLKKQAMAAGMTREQAVKASRPELEKFLAGAEKSKSEKKSSKKSAKPEKAEKKNTKKSGKKAKKSEKVEKPAKAKKSSTKKAEKPKKTTKTKAKATKSDGEVGRSAIGDLDWQIEHEDWNPRKGGATEKMFKALKKAKGNVEKAYDALVDDVYDFVGKEKRDGTKRTKDEAKAMLKYRLNRTKFEFAVRTEQHEVATNRIEYGTGDRAKGNKAKPKAKKAEKTTKPKKAAKKSTKTETKKAGKKKTGSKKKK